MDMNKLLITSGCSNTDFKYHSYIKHGINVWPNIVAEHNERSLINVASYGASNDLIENTIFDTVTKYKNHDCVVMVLWTDIRRLNIADDWSHKTLLPNDYEVEYKNLDFYKAMFKKFFRNMRRTKFICDYYGFPCYFRHGGWQTIKDRNIVSSIRDWLKNHPIQEEMNMSWMEILYGCIAFPNEYFLENHPNNIGHQRIANMFITEMCDPIIHKHWVEKDFIYE